jgi:hypothetical protein
MRRSEWVNFSTQLDFVVAAVLGSELIWERPGAARRALLCVVGPSLGSGPSGECGRLLTPYEGHAQPVMLAVRGMYPKSRWRLLPATGLTIDARAP